MQHKLASSTQLPLRVILDANALLLKPWHTSMRILTNGWPPLLFEVLFLPVLIEEHADGHLI